ncbi:MAG: Lrp/AsnC family transcriptional regulator [Parvibaculaceae bacterium]
MSNTFAPEPDEDPDKLSIASRSSPYDALNRQIVRLMQNDGRMSFRAIADLLNVSEGTVRNRVTWMKEAGVLTIVAVIDPTAIRYRADAMLGIKVAPGKSPAQVADRLGKFNGVVYVLWVSGRYDLLVEVVFDTHDELTNFLTTHCYREADIASTEVMTGLVMYKNQFLLKHNIE